MCSVSSVVCSVSSVVCSVMCSVSSVVYSVSSVVCSMVISMLLQVSMGESESNSESNRMEVLQVKMPLKPD